MVLQYLAGPYTLTQEYIHTIVREKHPGVFVVGNRSQQNEFIPRYVGMAHSDLHKRLLDFVGKYAAFKFTYCTSPKEAFKKECMIYHGCGPYCELENQEHPSHGEEESWRCPICGI